MNKITLDLTSLKNELTQLNDEAIKGNNATSDNQRRDILARVIEKIKTIRASLDSAKFEIK